jgi:hypothetical protein
MDTIVAYCGLTCSECEAYIATQEDDSAALATVAAKWSEEYGGPGFAAESVICDGCTTHGGRLCSHAPQCGIRTCAMERGVETCGHCADYACEMLDKLFLQGSEPRQTLDKIRAELGL